MEELRAFLINKILCLDYRLGKLIGRRKAKQITSVIEKIIKWRR